MTNPRLTAALEVAAFTAFALISKELVDPYTARYAGPATLIATILLLTGYMHLRGERWSSMGLLTLRGAKARLLVIPQAALAFLAVFAIMSFVTFVVDALGFEFMSDPHQGDESRWGEITGNLEIYLILLALSWLSAGFAEEMFFRGFLITRMQTVFSGVRLGSAISVLLPAILFGYVHFYYQGLQGFVNASVIGLIFGTVFLLYKRNLWPLVLVHGSINTMGFTADFMGWSG